MGADDNKDIPAIRDDNQTPAPSDAAPTSDAHREAAADVTRDQIDRIYERGSPYKSFEGREPSANAYNRTHAPESQLNAEQFQHYHSAWQDYYQKYYESYYTKAVRQTAEQLKRKHDLEHGTKPGAISSQPARAEPQAETAQTAVRQLQSNLKAKVSERADKVRRSRHFWPLVTAASVAAVFVFLQYNRLLVANVAAYVSPGSVDPQNIIVDPGTDVSVGPENKIVIPKINVDAPAIYSVTTYDNDEIERQLKDGVVHYPIPGANGLPGQVGNNVIGGHSSNDVFDDGRYKFVFVQLEKIVVGDTFYLHYNGTRYTYHVTRTATIEPNQIDVLTQPTDKPIVTLITCTPIGTALQRFIVVGEQVSPDPTGAGAADNSSTGASTSIPGNAPTLLDRLFGR